VLVAQMPSDPQVTRFYTALLTALGAPLRPSQRLPVLEQLALRLLRETAVRVLVIDELHNTLAGSSDARRQFLVIRTRTCRLHAEQRHTWIGVRKPVPEPLC
jgi:hypothetical protein